LRLIFKIFVLNIDICNTLCICLHATTWELQKIFLCNWILGSPTKRLSKHFNFGKNWTAMLKFHMKTYVHFCSCLASNPLGIYQNNNNNKNKNALNKSCREKWITHFMTNNSSVNQRVSKILKLKGLNAPELLFYAYVS
jgi:hypothetical protein